MKQLTCELCGSTDLIKQDGMYVCQSCGAKYTVDEARKMMAEGSENVTDSPVKASQPSELENLYILARRAKNDNNSENAQKFYEQILIKDPSSWEANFYSVYYQSMNCKIFQIESAANRLTNCEETIFQLIKDNVLDPEEQKKVLEEVVVSLMNISTMLNKGAVNHYTGISSDIQRNYTQELLDRNRAIRRMMYNCGDYLIKVFGDKYGELAAYAWQAGIIAHDTIMKVETNKEGSKNIIMSYAAKVKKYDPSYTAPEIDTSSSGGCYVATAVYGSYDCPQVWTLRRYRDYTLAETWYGRAFIHIYYAISPTLVKWFGHTEWFKQLWKEKLDRMVANLNARGVLNTPYEDKIW